MPLALLGLALTLLLPAGRFNAYFTPAFTDVAYEKAAAAKVLKTFTAEFKKPAVKIGIVDKAVVSAEQIGAIADLPSRDVLLATLLGVLNAPASKLVRVLNEPASSLARLLKAKAEKDGAVAA